mmetsp:Transcript_3865/g.6685  ORF Transcript_3865/g.6685 Transcript_3865/m.6685 type:complete len:258 (+) Transcript_3865:177-950(+)
MVSKKRAQGKARKAAKAAKAEAKKKEDSEQQGEATLEAQIGRMQINDAVCQHGDYPSKADERIVTEFIYAYLAEYNDENKWGIDLATALKGAYKATIGMYAAVWGNLDKLEFVISRFVFVATRYVLNGDIPQACINVTIANYFEQFIACTFRNSQPSIDGPKIFELHDADVHTLISYLKKRIPCKCLDKKYKEVKHVKKMGECCNPCCSLPRGGSSAAKCFIALGADGLSIALVSAKKLLGKFTRLFATRIQPFKLI